MKSFSIKVIANSKTQGVKEENGILKVKVMAVAVNGAANKAVIKLLADYFKVKQKDIVITKGEKSANKIIEIKSLQY